MKTILTIILLAHNEEKTILDDIKKIHNIILKKIKDTEFIICQDGSIDKTHKIISSIKKKYNINYIHSAKRLGVHKALLLTLKKSKGEFIFFVDSGNKFNYREFWKLYKYRKKYEIVSGLRVNRKDQVYRILLTYFFNVFLRFFTISKFRDIDSGFKIFNKKSVKKAILLKKYNSHFYMSEICLKIIYMGYLFKEVNVNYFQRFSKSRATSLTRIPVMIVSFLINFIKLKNQLSSIK
ncbi:MAG TPA: glycosyltransferase family 2 protein [Candidatus Pelagibacter bacterium]|nr:hypothetical protein [Pelagibacteraceae bacterium]HJN84647.1 glycosyltransferase family 2 protein [Candidatus Pelagibacter bacterium]